MLVRNKDIEERNTHLKAVVLVVIISIVLGGLPELSGLIMGVDFATACDLKTDTCMNPDNFLVGILSENWPDVTIGFKIMGGLLFLLLGGYKLTQA